jgi:hypothetical protein
MSNIVEYAKYMEQEDSAWQPQFAATYRLLTQELAPGQSVFPYELENADALYGSLLGEVTVNDQRSFVEVRQDGAANDVLTTFYTAGFDRWHTEAGRLPADSPEDKLIYDIAGLYGVRMASDRLYNRTGERMQADDLIAYVVARETVLGGYDLLEVPPEAAAWEREKNRECVNTGSDTLGVTLGFAHDRLVEQYKQLYGTEPSVPKERIYNALYMGMLDGSVFFNTYMRAKQGLGPELFPIARAYAAADRDTVLMVDTAMQTPLPGHVSSLFLRGGETSHSFDVTAAGDILVTTRSLVQTGPGEFKMAHETTKLSADDPSLQGLFDGHPTSYNFIEEQRKVRRITAGIAAAGLVGGLADGLREAATINASVSAVAGESVRGMLIGLFVGGIGATALVISQGRKKAAANLKVLNSFLSDGVK